ncbi:hypothetical protein BJX64DRAFT_268815 [Aspergillus heterothallicus]
MWCVLSWPVVSILMHRVRLGWGPQAQIDKIASRTAVSVALRADQATNQALIDAFGAGKHVQ